MQRAYGAVTIEPQQIKEIEGMDCPYEKTIRLIGDKWILLIVRRFYVEEAPMRFNALLEALKPISSKTLSAKLKTLMRYGILEKEVVSVTPLIATYRLTDKGADLMTVLDSMASWSEKWHA